MRFISAAKEELALLSGLVNIREIFFLVSLLGAAVIFLGISFWLFNAELYDFLIAIWVAIRWLFIQLSRMTLAGIAKYLGAQVLRFVTIEFWKYLAIRFLKNSIIPVIFAWIFGSDIESLLGKLKYQIRKYRVLYKRWYSRLPKYQQIFFWLISGVILTALSVQLIGIGVLIFAFSLPAWAMKFVGPLLQKLWLVLQRIVFRTFVFIASKLGWKGAEKYVSEKLRQRIEKTQELIETKQTRAADYAKTKAQLAVAHVGGWVQKGDDDVSWTAHDYHAYEQALASLHLEQLYLERGYPYLPR